MFLKEEAKYCEFKLPFEFKRRVFTLQDEPHSVLMKI